MGDSVVELRDLFLYLSALVEEQGEKLDSIEIHVENTREFTGDAVVELGRAKEHKEAYEAKRMYLWLMSSGVVLVLLIVALGSLCPVIGCFSMLSNVSGCFGGCSRGNNSNQQ